MIRIFKTRVLVYTTYRFEFIHPRLLTHSTCLMTFLYIKKKKKYVYYNIVNTSYIVTFIIYVLFFIRIIFKLFKHFKRLEGFDFSYNYNIIRVLLLRLQQNSKYKYVKMSHIILYITF